MNEILFEVEFKSDIVLPATSNTEGNIEQLDFIPGSNFLGMVAKNYGQFDDFKVFHSGAVRFGDANVLRDGKQTYKMPLSYFYKKLDRGSVYNHHFLSKEQFSSEDKGGLGQLKQMRQGYITQDKELVEFDYNYSQKSAYNTKTRKSDDGKMYGYSALPAGLKWQFSLKYDDTLSDDDLELIKDTLLNSTKLGKSRSSQYGQIKITLSGNMENIENESLDNEVILYANSRLALTDGSGNQTYDLNFLFEKMDTLTVDYEKTQLRTSTFTPYNRVRVTKDSERVCINKGSVIVLNGVKLKHIDILKAGVGSFKSEGFGELLINPLFLEERDKFSIEKVIADNLHDNERVKITHEFTDTTVQFLAQRHNVTMEKLDIAKEVADFIESNIIKVYGEKMNSQWGSIRALCSHNSESKIQAAVSEYISSGVAKEKWEGSKKSKLLEAIGNTADKLTFTKLLAIQMPKEMAKRGRKND